MDYPSVMLTDNLAFADPQAPPGLIEAGVYPTSATAFDHGLVVLAMGLPYWLLPSDTGYRLLVEPDAGELVREQLVKFDRESIGWPPQPIPIGPHRYKMEWTALFWALVVVAVYFGQVHEEGGLEALGSLDARAIFDQGQWWRIGTALFLHADLGHLLSNVLSGIFVFSAVSGTIGRLRGWLLLAAASLAGNFAVAALNHSASYRSLGASTAIFAGLGLLTGHAIRSVRHAGPHSLRSILVPLAAGTSLLAIYGAGGLEVDVVAHLMGFVAGLAFGFAMGMEKVR